MFEANTLTRSRHIIGTPPVFHKIRGMYPSLPVFMYRHAETENWVLAEWINKDSGLFVEVLNFGKDPNVFPPSLRHELHRRMDDSLSPERILEIIDKEHYEHDRAKTIESFRQVENRERWLRNKAGPAAVPRARGFSLK